MCGARASDRVSALHRRLYLRCTPSWTSDYYCATERDNPALTCTPLTQARIAAFDTYFYYGPADTCEASARAMHAHVLAPDARARGLVLAASLGIGLARCSSLALPAGLSDVCVRACASALVCVRARVCVRGCERSLTWVCARAHAHVRVRELTECESERDEAGGGGGAGEGGRLCVVVCVHARAHACKCLRSE